MSLSIKKNNVAQVFSDKVIDFTNVQSGDFVQNTFVDDGLINYSETDLIGILTELFLEAILCKV